MVTLETIYCCELLGFGSGDSLVCGDGDSEPTVGVPTGLAVGSGARRRQIGRFTFGVGVGLAGSGVGVGVDLGFGGTVGNGTGGTRGSGKAGSPAAESTCWRFQSGP